METPEQVIAKIRNAADDMEAMKVLKECGYELKALEEAEDDAAKIEVEFGGGMSPREKFMQKRMGMARGNA